MTLPGLQGMVLISGRNVYIFLGSANLGTLSTWLPCPHGGYMPQERNVEHAERVSA